MVIEKHRTFHPVTTLLLKINYKTLLWQDQLCAPVAK